MNPITGLLLQGVWLIPALPLLAALLVAMRMLRGKDKGDEAEPATARLVLGATALSLLLLLGLDAAALAHGTPGTLSFGTWLSSGKIDVQFSFLLDRLSMPLATLVAFVALLTQRFAVNYLHREAGFHRFFFGLSLFTAGMLLIVLAGNAVLLFAGWEMAGISSWLLIGYAYERPTATGNALRAFVTNRIGDTGLVLAIALAFLWIGSAEWSAILAKGRLGTLSAGLLAMGFVAAALVKSAQVPFSPWIARALEGPTPSSAIFYGALMVHAGVYLLLRLEPLLLQAPALMSLIAVLGLLTALYGYFSGLTQTDVKSTLMFATTTQVGLMFLACGLGWFTLAAWHLGLHAMWRAYQFLASPSYMHLVSAPARPAPAWLRNRQGLYTAALQRFWLEALGDWLLQRPTQAMARDVRNLDDHVVSRMVGLPEQARVNAFLLVSGEEMSKDKVMSGSGLAGALLEWLANHLQRFESRLLFQGREGRLRNMLGRIGSLLLAAEILLGRPRYLLLLIMATLVVVL
ncbi:MAG: proton-conducting transporter membrane subunit [Sulfurimicrobium sp.]|jgi:NADH:ubiquinone oxidoreductase subunit 2 (subunit N)|nr:proton-conducting transporter membrane subunit [Sulfurimicrobium sp.]MDZ7655876.1 proton-conducting transporter membrane subunit [Sulfurimicrobium sp.]